MHPAKKPVVSIQYFEDIFISEIKISNYNFNSIFKKYLTPREIKIIKLYFGLDENNENTLETIGEKMGISCERVRQIKKHALDKLKKVMQKQ